MSAECQVMYRTHYLHIVIFLGFIGCFSEVTLPECVVDADCVNAGFCRCMEGYCFQCEDDAAPITCDGNESAECTVAKGQLDGLQAVAAPVIDNKDRVWLAWQAATENRLTQWGASGTALTHKLPEDLGAPFGLMASFGESTNVQERMLVAGVGLYLYRTDSDTGTLWLPDSGTVASWPVQSSTAVSSWFVMDTESRLHNVTFDGDSAASETVLVDLPVNTAVDIPVQSMLFRDRYLVLATSSDGTVVVDMGSNVKAVLQSSALGSARSLAAIDDRVVVCTNDAKLQVADIVDDDLDVVASASLSVPCSGAVGDGELMVIAGDGYLSGFTTQGNGSNESLELRSEWTISAPTADVYPLRAVDDAQDVFLVSSPIGHVLRYSSDGEPSTTYQVSGELAPAAPLAQFSNGDVFHLVGDGRFFRIGLGLQRPQAGWNRFRRDGMSTALSLYP